MLCDQALCWPDKTVQRRAPRLSSAAPPPWFEFGARSAFELGHKEVARGSESLEAREQSVVVSLLVFGIWLTVAVEVVVAIMAVAAVVVRWQMWLLWLLWWWLL